MDERLYFLISIPEGFKDKFVGFLRNLNTVNGTETPPVIIESFYGEKKIVAVPKSEEQIDA